MYIVLFKTICIAYDQSEQFLNRGVIRIKKIKTLIICTTTFSIFHILLNLMAPVSNFKKGRGYFPDYSEEKKSGLFSGYSGEEKKRSYFPD